MRANDLDISQYKSIEEIYTFIDNNAFQLDSNWEFVDLFIKFRDQTTHETEKQKAQWEMEFFMFEYKGAKIFSLSYATTKNIGEIEKYPNLNEFQQLGFAYLKQRLTETKQPLLLARYNHLLWNSPKGIKNKSFAVAAIDNYIMAIKGFYSLFETSEKREPLFCIGRIFETLVGLCDEVKSNIVELKTLTRFLLFDAKRLDFYSKHGIINDMLEYPGIFKKDDFDNTLSIYRKEVKENANQSPDSLLVSYHIPTAIKIAIKTKADVREWHNEMGLAYMCFAGQETQQDRFWIKLDHYARAISSFGFAGNKAKKAEAEKLYSELKPHVTLPTHQIDFGEEFQKEYRELQERIKQSTSEILNFPPYDIYKAISSGSFFPKHQNVLKMNKDRQTDFTQFASAIYFDKNKNISKPNKDEENERGLYSIYEQQMQLSSLPYLHFILVPGIKSGHLTFENFIKYLAENTWIGKPFFRNDLGGVQEEINWIALLSPSIFEFFIQIQAWANSKYYKPSFILCIDSLTLKMEGLFRNFCERLSIPISVGRNKAMQEAYMHNLLEHETIKKHFNEDDLLFFNYLFSSDFGLNLRNNVAHCFYNIDEYNHQKMLLLLAALLRIGKYNVKKSR